MIIMLNIINDNKQGDNTIHGNIKQNLEELVKNAKNAIDIQIPIDFFLSNLRFIDSKKLYELNNNITKIIAINENKDSINQYYGFLIFFIYQKSDAGKNIYYFYKNFVSLFDNEFINEVIKYKNNIKKLKEIFNEHQRKMQ